MSVSPYHALESSIPYAEPITFYDSHVPPGWSSNLLNTVYPMSSYPVQSSLMKNRSFFTSPNVVEQVAAQSLNTSSERAQTVIVSPLVQRTATLNTPRLLTSAPSVLEKTPLSAPASSSENRLSTSTVSFDSTPSESPREKASNTILRDQIKKQILDAQTRDEIYQAFDFLKNLFITDPENMLTLTGAALLYLKTGNFQKAEEYLTKVLEKDPQNYEAYLSRGLIYIRLYCFSKGVEDLIHCYALHQQLADLDFIIHSISKYFKSDSRMIGYLTHAISTNPNNPYLKILFSMYCMSEEMNKDAEKILRRDSLCCEKDSLSEKMVERLQTILAHKKTKEKMSIRQILN